MPARSCHPALARLADEILTATSPLGRVDDAALLASIRGALRSRGLLGDEQTRADERGYARHLLHAEPHGRFAIVAIVWAPGQASPVHGHTTWCAVGFLSGELVESHYARPQGAEPPRLVRRVTRRPGDVCFDRGGDGLHSIANESEANAISLHAYGIAWERMATDLNVVYPPARALAA